MTITVTGLGGGGGGDDHVTAWQCPADAEEASDCDWSDAAQQPIDRDTAVLRLRVDALITAGMDDQRDVDCREVDACVIGVARAVGGFGALLARVPTHFDPDALPAPRPELTVTPDSDVVDGQQVHVEGSGFVWTYDALVVQCAADATSWDDCDETYRSIPLVGTGFEQDVRLASVIVTGDGGTVDCRGPGACVLLAPSHYGFFPRTTAVAPLQFDPDGPLPATPSITITPDRDLVDGQRVTVRVTELQAQATVHLYQCTSEPSWSTCRPLTGDQAGVDGSLTLDMPLFVMLTIEDGEVDCRTISSRCWLVAAPAPGPGGPRTARVALAFDPDAPLRPPGNLSVGPATGLSDGTAVSVEGDSWLPDAPIVVSVCAANSDDLCDEQAVTFLTSDGTGRWSTELVVEGEFLVGGDVGVDCRRAPGCEVVARETPSGRSTSVPITFGPAVTSPSTDPEPSQDPGGPGGVTTPSTGRDGDGFGLGDLPLTGGNVVILLGVGMGLLVGGGGITLLARQRRRRHQSPESPGRARRSSRRSPVAPLEPVAHLGHDGRGPLVL